MKLQKSGPLNFCLQTCYCPDGGLNENEDNSLRYLNALNEAIHHCEMIRSSAQSGMHIALLEEV